MTQKPIRYAIRRPLTPEGRAIIRELASLIRDYWEPQTRRGYVAKERALERAAQFLALPENDSHASVTKGDA